MKKPVYLGIDVGSRYVKTAFSYKGKILDLLLFDTSLFYSDLCKHTPNGLKIKSSAFPYKITGITGCGYGRDCLKFEGIELITEMKAHSAGGFIQSGMPDFLLLDLGGQDSKLLVVKNKKLTEFISNDRCAACTGRFLENMSSVLNMPLSELSSHYSDPVSLSSTCAVFSETELISRMASGETRERLAAGINYSIYRRISGMLGKFSRGTLLFAGGVAYNQAIRKFLEDEGWKVRVLSYPQHNAAIGCLVVSGKINPDEKIFDGIKGVKNAE